MANNDYKAPESKVIVALDYADAASALYLVNQLDPALCKLKVGKELFTAAGPQLVEKLVEKNFSVFLDLKFHDIPTTVKKACQAASSLGVWMLNVHASGGSAMMNAAAEGVDIGSQGSMHNINHKPFLIAVTVLTSSNQATLHEIGVENTIENQVLKLAKLTQAAGLNGVVCSALEAQLLRQHLPNDFLLVTPGIRPASASLDDQSRVLTPSQALRMGVNYLVIGRPITQAAKPIEALIAINQEIQVLQ
ncbi:MAG: orotidine-5'-phosphate decarboxylase [Methylotenera sp.]